MWEKSSFYINNIGVLKSDRNVKSHKREKSRQFIKRKQPTVHILFPVAKTQEIRGHEQRYFEKKKQYIKVLTGSVFATSKETIDKTTGLKTWKAKSPPPVIFTLSGGEGDIIIIWRGWCLS